MTPYRAAHDALFRSVAEILVRDYDTPSETADTVAEWRARYYHGDFPCISIVQIGILELAALIADAEGYERRKR